MSHPIIPLHDARQTPVPATRAMPLVTGVALAGQLEGELRDQRINITR